MDNLFAMSIGNGLGQLMDKAGGNEGRLWLAGTAICQTTTIDELHRIKRLSINFTHVVDGHNVCLFQAGGCLDLYFETRK